MQNKEEKISVLCPIHSKEEKEQNTQMFLDKYNISVKYHRPINYNNFTWVDLIGSFEDIKKAIDNEWLDQKGIYWNISDSAWDGSKNKNYANVLYNNKDRKKFYTQKELDKLGLNFA